VPIEHSSLLILTEGSSEFSTVAGSRADPPHRAGRKDGRRDHHPRYRQGKTSGGRSEVIAAGPGTRGDDGKLHPLDVKIGDRVLFGKWSGTEIKIDGEDLVVMKETDIMGVVA